MALFNKRIIQKRIPEKPTISKEALKHASEWADLINSKVIFSQKETSLYSEFMQKILVGILGFKPVSGDGEWTVAHNHSIGTGEVEFALGFFDKKEGKPTSQIFAPVELKGPNNKDLDALMPGRNKSPVQQAWEYAIDAPGTKWVIVSNYIELRLYAFGQGRKDYETWDLSKLSDPRECSKLQLILGADNLLFGASEALLTESLNADKEITNELYLDYKTTRQNLINSITKSHPEIDPIKIINLSQKILDRILFIAFAEDTSLLPAKSLEQAFAHRDQYNPHPVWENFKGLFRAINEGNNDLKIPKYNGGLFAEDKILDGIIISDKICHGFKIIGDYDFETDISVNILGHIFEQSIADIETLQAKAKGEEPEKEKRTSVSGKRKREGVIYTPDYVAHFIVEKTIGIHLEEIFKKLVSKNSQKGNWEKYEEIKWKNKGSELKIWRDYRKCLAELKIVDPACGSGAFLVATFDFMKAEYERVNKKIEALTNKPMDIFDTDREILTNNLYGVDINSESVEITKLSLWLKTAKRGKTLDVLRNNILVGDSIIEDSSYTHQAFTWKGAFPEIFKDGGFDIVIGNPPYVRMEFLKIMKPYLEKRYEVVSDRADLFCYFYELGIRILKTGGKLGFISSSTFFKTRGGGALRNFMRSKTSIENVVNFGDLQVFEGVTTYPTIIILKNITPSNKQKIKFWNLTELPKDNFEAEFEKNLSYYPQEELGESSWEFENSIVLRLRKKLFEGKNTFKDVFGNPQAGIKTGFNRAFIINSETRKQLIQGDPKNKALLKPYLFGANLHKWGHGENELWIIYTPKGKTEIDHFPTIKEYLLQFKSNLEGRATNQLWYELQQAQYKYSHDYNNNKIIYRDIANSPSFSVDKTSSFIDMTCFSIPCGSFSLCSLLNSKVIWFLLKSKTTIARGGYFRMKTQYIGTLPIPEFSDDGKKNLENLGRRCHELTALKMSGKISFFKRILDLNPKQRKIPTILQNWWKLENFQVFHLVVKKIFETDIPLKERSEWESFFYEEKEKVWALKAEIKHCEGKIDKIVYDLFDLAPEEIKLLEANI